VWLGRAVLAAQIGDRDARLVLFQYSDDLVFGESAALHLWSLRVTCFPQIGPLSAGIFHL
jgi:hypothetical protein